MLQCPPPSLLFPVEQNEKESTGKPGSPALAVFDYVNMAAPCLADLYFCINILAITFVSSTIQPKLLSSIFCSVLSGI